MLAGPKCPIKCKWHLQGWTGSVHLSVDESCIRSPLSNQFDVTLLCCATAVPREALLNSPIGHRHHDPWGLGQSQTDHSEMEKVANNLKTIIKALRTTAQWQKKILQRDLKPPHKDTKWPYHFMVKKSQKKVWKDTQTLKMITRPANRLQSWTATNDHYHYQLICQWSVCQCLPKTKMTSSNAFFCPQPKNILFTHIEQ